ncbi:MULTISPECIES: glutamate synthase large subunit [Cellulophaga]|uniref:Glutamate synthase [NADPH] large chain n=2 Tax=Cellulophaga TaxID=104264 RepID=F0RDU6_CELLC|nr:MULTISPECIES: glutamate synthase large subunit [Cellulophaga]ADY29857.1 Glutamate synthase (ferredoxin) [Cellulophaga lytica DSM 7489]AIM60856.1 glutamate synthase [Cellulophaga lytica]APU10726.1 glutamate synthase subunit alpha [Cellulophaga lytica]EWH15095.1 Glutamate synthase (ferredoxin) [Cellulophaga geojensis KL-A]MDO6854561.1 glutamate synthase large subunit [Cellulophaga lytica]
MKLKKQGLYLPDFEHDNCGAGFICSLKGKKSNDIIHKALEILDKLEHRGAVSSDGKTGDGAGILIDIPHDYFTEVCDFNLPEPGEYAVANIFLPQKQNQRDFCISVFEENIKKQGLKLLGWRDAPVNKNVPGRIAMETEPFVKQIFIAKEDSSQDYATFNLKLYIARKVTEHTILSSKLSESGFFYVPSLSTKIIIFKGLLMPQDIKFYFKDLMDPRVVTRLALVHQRFSTNTFPTWDLAQPFRYMCHNGEINTLRGNVSRMRSREELLKSDLFGDEIKNILPIILPGKSDSATMDMVVELLLMTGRSLPEVMMIMVPEAWEKNPDMSPAKRAFYEYNSCMMEPWDGPASVPFTDGNYIGAVLDRNGLRPSRYSVTKDGYVIMSSETGVVDIEPENIEFHGRLEPGKMFLVNMEEGRIVNDEEIKEKIAQLKPYQKWLDNNLVHLKDIPYNDCPLFLGEESLEKRKSLFGYTLEDINTIILPMGKTAKEPIGSMGSDTPIAVLSEKPQLIYNYFKQLFAQVTNPPLDGIREELITDISLTLGSDHNIFDFSELHCRKLKIQNPVISKEDLDKIKNYDASPDYKVTSIPILYKIARGHNALEEALASILDQASKAIDNGTNIIILSDRNVDKDNAPIPALLALSFVNSGLQKLGKRSKLSIIIESAEPREVHHFALLFGYGASAVNPYLVNEIIAEQIEENDITDITFDEAIKNYNKGIGKGVLKVMNKIGISTLNSYRGSQLFECIGINTKVVDKYFPNTPTRIQGIGLYQIEKEISKRHQKAFNTKEVAASLELEMGGAYRWRRDGEKHLFNPLTIAKLQKSVRNNEPETYKEYSKLINEQSKHLMTIRGLFEFSNYDPIPIEEVEPWTDIVKRFKTGAMSYGSISKEAHENLAIAMNRIGGKSNSGEGGEDAERFYKNETGDWKNSAIKQVASGRFGVTSNYLSSAKEIQIKMAQGAKPGEGGQLPGPKVNPSIAKTRNSTPYVGLISPPPHHDIYSIEDLSQLIYDLKSANREARINVKLVSEVGVGTVAAGVAKAKADVILVSGHDGGTGASPLTSLKHAGLPWELGIAEAQQTLVMNDLRNRVVVECDGQLKTGRDVAIACLLGAEEFGFATAPLVASGCIMMRVCHLNTCPVGIATQNPELRKKFKGKPEHVVNYMYFIAQELREIMAQLGFRTVNEMVGQVQKLDRKKAIEHYKAEGIDLTPILHQVSVPKETKLYNTQKQEHDIYKSIEFKIIEKAHPSLFRKEKLTLDFPIKNTDRAVGAIISNEISKTYGAKGLPINTLRLNFTGSAGQSFGAFATRGLTMTVNGNTNDYLGKGLSGGKLVIKVPEGATIIPEENVITGNVTLYGATAGRAYINGKAGERFCVRNSGAKTVVEGIGDHGCEYMTGGVAVILGEVGRNFGAGMSGGIAYVLDPNKTFEKNCNKESLNLLPVEEANDIAELKDLIESHYNYTMSPLAQRLLENWENSLPMFVKVFPEEYRQALKRLEEEQKASII